MSTKSVHEQVYMSREMRDQVTHFADRMHLSRSAAMCTLIERGLDAEQILARVRESSGAHQPPVPEHDKKTFLLLREVLWVTALSATQGDAERAKKLFSAALTRADGEPQ